MTKDDLLILEENLTNLSVHGIPIPSSSYSLLGKLIDNLKELRNEITELETERDDLESVISSIKATLGY